MGVGGVKNTLETKGSPHNSSNISIKAVCARACVCAQTRENV